MFKMYLIVLNMYLVVTVFLKITMPDSKCPAASTSSFYHGHYQNTISIKLETFQIQEYKRAVIAYLFIKTEFFYYYSYCISYKVGYL